MNCILSEIPLIEEHMDEDEVKQEVVLSDSTESGSIEQLAKYLVEKLSHLDLSKKSVKKIGDIPISINGDFSVIYRGSYRRKEVAIKVARQTMTVDQRTLNV